MVRRVPFALREKVAGLIYAEGWCGEEFVSPWASPVVLVRKKCGGLRFVLTRGDLMQSPTGMFLPYPELMIF